MSRTLIRAISSAVWPQAGQYTARVLLAGRVIRDGLVYPLGWMEDRAGWVNLSGVGLYTARNSRPHVPISCLTILFSLYLYDLGTVQQPSKKKCHVLFHVWVMPILELLTPKMAVKWICVCKALGIQISEWNEIPKSEQFCQNSICNFEVGIDCHSQTRLICNS